MEHDKIKRGSYLRKPRWLYSKIEGGEKFSFVEKTVEENGLHTICSSGKCPNKGHCWKCGTATFMILGDRCTRACRFCATLTGRPLPPEPKEPEKVAHSIQLMKLKHCVITSVDRDDLPDKGAGHWAATIRAIRAANPDVVIEVLIPDYRGEELRTVLEARPDIVGHNLETVRRLTPSIRSRATYENSLGVLQEVATAGFLAKTGIMLGLGETPEEDILFGLRNMRLPRQEINQRLHDTLACCGLTEKKDFPARLLSGGEKRRLAVAGILSMKREIIIFDEPFANLDFPGVQQVCAILRELKTGGITVIVLTH